MEHLIGRIQSTNYLYFTEDELDPKGKGHNKSLYIIVKCKDCVVAKVLVDWVGSERVVKTRNRLNAH